MNPSFDQISGSVAHKEVGARHSFGIDDGVVDHAQPTSGGEVHVKTDPRRHDVGAVDHGSTTGAFAQ